MRMELLLEMLLEILLEILLEFLPEILMPTADFYRLPNLLLDAQIGTMPLA